MTIPECQIREGDPRILDVRNDPIPSGPQATLKRFLRLPPNVGARAVLGDQKTLCTKKSQNLGKHARLMQDYVELTPLNFLSCNVEVALRPQQLKGQKSANPV